MDAETLKKLLLDNFPDATITVDGHGDRFQITIVDASFENQSKLTRHQAVNSCVSPLIQDGTIHALTIKAYSPNELNAP